MLVLNAGLRVVSASRSFYRTFDVTPLETEGYLVYELGDGQWNIPELRRLLEDILPGHSEFDDYEVTHHFPDIGQRTILLNARRMFRPGNGSQLILLAMEDITERRRAERLLQEQERTLRALFEGTLDAILIADDTGVFTRVNAAATALLGYPAEALIGKRISDLMADASGSEEAFDAQWKSFLAQGHQEGIITLRRADGGLVHTEFRARAHFVPGRHVSTLRDITERTRLEAERAAAFEALEAAYEREHRIAEALQHPLTMEVAEDAFPGLHIATLYEAAWQEADVGGDLFDAFALPRGLVALALADVSGKGLTAAARAIQIKEVLRAFCREYPYAPNQILARLNDFACDTRRYDDRSDESFVCLSLAILDPVTGEGGIVSAGCEPPAILRANGTTESIDTAGLPLGIRRENLYMLHPFRLAAGDILLLVTDGITEARRKRQFLGYEGMLDLARQHRASRKDATLRETGKAILEGAKAFAGSRLRDDACLLLARKQ
jgi:PAS domain S-box-containing protein